MNEVWEKQQTHEDARKMRRTKIVVNLFIFLENGESVTLEVMIWLEEWIDREKFLIWRRKCSAYARQRMRPKFTNFCKPEQVSTREYGKMLKRIRVLKDGKVPAMESRNWKIEGLKRKSRGQKIRGF